MKDYMAIKVDMSKAYDRLEWTFLEKTLLAYGFHPTWTARIMTLVKGDSYKLKVNGFLSPPFTPGRGLRQGDPLSPYLFGLATDVLSFRLTQALQEGKIEGFRFTPHSQALTHLFFVDDSLLFAEATVREAMSIIQTLNLYNRA